MPKLPSGDLLIIAGDITARDTDEQWQDFFFWLSNQDYEKKILIAGNHDNYCKNHLMESTDFEYLCDSATEYRGLKIYGSPHTKWFHGVNPSCKAFMSTSDTLSEKFNLIPQDIDILITHTPPLYILDLVEHKDNCGSSELTYAMPDSVSLHIFGHIHGFGGKWLIGDTRLYVNACVVNERYEHTIDYVQIEYDEKKKEAINIETRFICA